MAVPHCFNPVPVAFGALLRVVCSCKKSGLISDTWTMYGKILAKDNHGHISVIRRHEDLMKYKVQGTRTEMSESSGQTNQASNGTEGRR